MYAYTHTQWTIYHFSSFRTNPYFRRETSDPHMPILNASLVQRAQQVQLSWGPIMKDLKNSKNAVALASETCFI